VAIEALEKRILRGLLQYTLSREAGAQTARETRLADAYRPFDDDELVSDFDGVLHELGLRQSTQTLGHDAAPELGHAPKPRYLQIRGDIRERIQNEVALHYPGMREGELGVLAALATEDEDVQIDDPRSPTLVPLGTAEPALERAQLREQRLRCKPSQQTG